MLSFIPRGTTLVQLLLTHTTLCKLPSKLWSLTLPSVPPYLSGKRLRCELYTNCLALIFTNHQLSEPKTFCLFTINVFSFTGYKIVNSLYGIFCFLSTTVLPSKHKILLTAHKFLHKPLGPLYPFLGLCLGSYSSQAKGLLVRIRSIFGNFNKHNPRMFETHQYMLCNSHHTETVPNTLLIESN